MTILFHSLSSDEKSLANIVLFHWILNPMESSYHRNVKNQLCEEAKGLNKTLAKLTMPKMSDHINVIAENGQDYRIMSLK